MSVILSDLDDFAAIHSLVMARSAVTRDAAWVAATLARMSRANALAYARTYCDRDCFFSAPGRSPEPRPRPWKAREILRRANARPVMVSAPRGLDALKMARLLAYNCASNGGSAQLTVRMQARWSHILARLLCRAVELVETDVVRA